MILKNTKLLQIGSELLHQINEGDGNFWSLVTLCKHLPFSNWLYSAICHRCGNISPSSPKKPGCRDLWFSSSKSS